MVIHEIYDPCKALRPYIKSYAVIKMTVPMSYNVLPGTGLVAGIYPQGLCTYTESTCPKLVKSEIFGLHDTYRTFFNPCETEFVTVHFTETGASSFFKIPFHELFNIEVSLENFFPSSRITELEERIIIAKTSNEKVELLDSFFLSFLRFAPMDFMVEESLYYIHQSCGVLSMSDLSKQLNVSQSRMERRFRRIVGATPKKFASLVRMNAILRHPDELVPLTKRAYDAGYFDQAHFIRDFKSFTGLSPKTLFNIMETVCDFKVYSNQFVV